MTPYAAGDGWTLYLGDCREVIPALDVTVDLVVADPPYGETSLPWDTWPDGWPSVVAGVTSSMWCFGSLRMFLARVDEFAAAGWKLSQDVVWVKPTPVGFTTDRFRRAHETVTHWYHGAWSDVHHQTPREKHHGPRVRRTTTSSGSDPAWYGRRNTGYWNDDGTRLARSTLNCASIHRGSHPTEKPVGILDPLIRYACPPPPRGTVLDPFAGSGSTLEAARASGRHAIGVEAHEPYAEAAARRLSQTTLEVPPS